MRAVIFFFAHAGIARVYQWLHWHLGCPDVALRVFCNPSVILPEIFVKFPFYQETCWGSPQLVYVQQEAYRHILKEFPEIEMIFMVSGQDIPIGSIETLLKISGEGKSYIPFTRTGSGGHSTRRDKLPLVDASSLQMAPPSYQTLQWTHLNKLHAEKIASFPLWKMMCIHTRLQYACNYYNKRMPVADEYWVWTILSQDVIENVRDMSLTEMDREGPCAPSPITWNGSEKQRVFISSSKDGDIYEDLTLYDAIAFAEKRGALFYRKVEFVKHSNVSS